MQGESVEELSSNEGHRAREAIPLMAKGKFNKFPQVTYVCQLACV